MKGSCKHVFISYSTKETDVAIRVCDYLESNGIPCWIAPRNVDAGGNYATQIVSAIKHCAALVLLASKNTNESGHVSNEVSIAFDNEKFIVPFKLESFDFTDEYLYFLGRKHWIEAHLDLNEGLRTLKENILSKTSIAQVMPQQAVVPERSMPVQPPVQETAPAPDSEPERSYSRQEIVDLLIEKSLKYPYNIYSKINTPQDREAFMEHAQVLFRETVTGYWQNKPIKEQVDIVSVLVQELSGPTGTGVQVRGLPGSAKNMILQLAFYQMLENFRNGESDCLPVYLSASYYEKLPYNPLNVESQMKEIIGKELQEYFGFLRQNPQVRPVLFIEAIREHNVAKISPENVVSDLWRPFGRFSRVCAVDYGLIKNRSRLKRVIPILGDGMGYTFVTNQVPIDDERACLAMIRSIFGIYGYDLAPQEVYGLLQKLKFPTIDIFLVRMIAKEMLSTYNCSEISLTGMYEKLALSELYGDEEKLRQVSRELFEYVFVQGYNFNTPEYNGAMWSLPHKHNTYLEFLIAYYFLHRIENYEETGEYSFFGTMLTTMSNHFLSSFLQEDYSRQETLLQFVMDNYNSFDIMQKSNSAYWLGRLTYKNLRNEAEMLLAEEFAKYKALVKTNNKTTQENFDNHFLFRAVCTGMVMQGQANIMDEYLCVVVTNDVANAINRGATVEFFGDNYQMVAHDSYYLDTDLSSGEQAMRILCSRIETALRGRNGGRFVENNLVTMLTLLQARLQNRYQPLKFDIMPFVEKSREFLQLYRSRPQNIVSGKLQYYFQSMEEDLAQYAEEQVSDIGPMIYNRYRSMNHVKRTQWVSREIADPESISEHSYGAWLLGMMFLPQEDETEGYCKREILDMLLVHDMAEAVTGDDAGSLHEPTKELKRQNDVLRKLFLKGTYPDIANMTYYYNVWTGYYSGLNINARIARDINLVQTVYTFCDYYISRPGCFTAREAAQWLEEKRNLRTDIGYQLFERLISGNQAFAAMMEDAAQ